MTTPETQETAETQEILVNGETRVVPRPLTVAGLLAHLQVGQTGSVAVERNKQIVPKHRHGETPVQAGDRLEVVTLVGGG